MRTVLLLLAFASIVSCGAMFGFFYAWLCSTMWGLDAADPRVAIAAMQAMNASVRNAAFAPAFFGTPLVLAFAAVAAYSTANRRAAAFFTTAALVYAIGSFGVTAAVNVPMNETLAATEIPPDTAAAETIWRGYSERWQFFNLIRTAASGAALILAALGLRIVAAPHSSRHSLAAS